MINNIVLKFISRKVCSFEEIHKSLRIDVTTLSGILDKLQDSGEIYKDRSLYYSTRKCGLIPARITRLCRTYGFAIDKANGEEYYIAGRSMKGALPNDAVILKEIKSKGESKEAIVINVAKKGECFFSGTIKKTKGRSYIIADSMLDYNVYCKNAKSVENNSKVVAKIIGRTKNHRDMTAIVVADFGDAKRASVCSDAILYANGVKAEFSKNVLSESVEFLKKGISNEEIIGRVDLRDDCVFTIDSYDTKDIDDAVSVERVNGGYKLYVHIADVSHYVKCDSQIDKEAYLRGNSIYYADRVIPMLPKELSNGICSLNEGEDRLAFTCEMTLDDSGKIASYKFYKSVIRSLAKGVYSEINEVLDGTADENTTKKYERVNDKLIMMKELSEKITKFFGSSLDIVTVESKIVCDNDGNVKDVKPRERGCSEDIIENFMICANICAADFGIKKRLPFVFRVHEPPPSEKLSQLSESLRFLGINAKDVKCGIKASELSDILKTREDKEKLSYLLLRAMSKAKYSKDNIGHYGLSLEEYSHFTSPIRRYSDLAIHRIMSDALYEKDNSVLRTKYSQFVESVANQTTAKEIEAVKIERECEECYKAEYMSHHIGEVFCGTVSGVTLHGLYVTLENTVEGLIKISDMPYGYYEIENQICMVNKHNGTRYTVGDSVKISVKACNVSRGTVDFDLI